MQPSIRPGLPASVSTLLGKLGALLLALVIMLPTVACGETTPGTGSSTNSSGSNSGPAIPTTRRDVALPTSPCGTCVRVGIRPPDDPELKPINDLYEAGELDLARTRYGDFLRDHPNNQTARFNLGVTLMDLQDITEARAAFDQVLQADPGNAAALVNRGILSADKAQAYAYFNQAAQADLRVDPNLAAVVFANRAAFLQQHPELGDAAPDLGRLKPYINNPQIDPAIRDQIQKIPLQSP